MEELALYLRESGLGDTTFWIPLLVERHVKSKAAFQQLEGDKDLLRELETKARSATEVALLRKVLKMDEKEEVNEQIRVWEIIGQLYVLESEGMKRQDEEVRQLESEVRTILQIPSESWISMELPFNEFLQMVKTCYEMSGQQVLPRAPLSDKDLLQSASGGRALQGILLTKHLQDQLEHRDRLLKVPEVVSLARLSQDEELSLKFSSAQSEDNYKKAMDVLGLSIAGSAGIPVYGYATISLGASEMIQRPCVKERYSSNVKYSIMKLASFSFEETDLTLCNEAKADLKEISIMLRSLGHSSTVYEACERFFRKYGSHVNSGPLVFGGSYCWICSSKNFSQEEEKILEEVHFSAISVTTGAPFAGVDASAEGNFDKIKTSYEGVCSKSALASTQLFVEKNSGPPEAAEVIQWKSGLVTNNSTWSLIDRGSKFIAVWDIIRQNHEQELGLVREILKEAWERMTGLIAELDLPKIYDPEEVLHEVSQWDVKNLSFKQVEDNLRHLLKVKRASPYIWTSEYLSKKLLQRLLESTVDTYQESMCSEHIKLLARQLAEKEVLNKFTTRIFPGVDKVAQWLYEPIKHARMLETIVDFESFEALQSSIELVLDMQSAKFPEKVDVSDTICRLRSRYKQTYDDVLITILTHPFKDAVSDDVFRPVTLSELYSLQQCFQQERVKYNKFCEQQNFLHLQAYLFRLAIDHASKPWQLLKEIEEVINSLQPPTFDKIRHVYLDSSTVSELGERLDKILLTSHMLKTDSVFENNPQAYAIFERLGLQECYTKPLQLQDALCVTTEPLEFSLGIKQLSDSKKLPYLVLHKIMSYDSLCRSDLMTNYSLELSSYSSSNGSNAGISPVDSLLALILCSDDLLRQDIFSRLAKCQLSVPFILPDPFTKHLIIPLWAMRSIIKEWKIINEGSRIVEQTQPIVSKDMPIVSFMRFSKQKYSKSGILNKVISTETSHCDHFFHYQCRGGQHKLVLADGLVDMCWYLPSGKAGDKFQNAVTFLNLHGDARNHHQQVKFLSKISSTCIALISKEDIENSRTFEVLESFSSSPGGLILLTEDSASLLKLKEKLPNACLLALTDHIRSIAEAMVHLIKLNLKKVPNYFSIEYAIENLCEFLVDEKSNFGVSGLHHAEQVMKELAYAQYSSDVSEQVLPLQGSTMWKLWASKNREVHRQKHRDGKTLQYSIARIRNEMLQIRRKQSRHNNGSLSPLMKLFVESLLQLQGPSKNYFLQSLKLELNKRSLDRLCRLGDDYQSTKNELQESRDESLLKKLKELEMEIIDLSFGLEHFLREVSQLYEAAAAQPSESSERYDYECLPKVAAELLIDGWPIEVMDGDAAHVPLTWVSAVLKEAAKILNDPKVFVLSVVGLQSTGKSTMLNTVFGLQFSVGAGRCTRGAFMQLLPVDEELREQTKCSYVLVVDTEGLRAPTSDPLVIHEHDNMLATLVIGLADMTFINIMGESAGDMDDILQTSVHAFLRMKLVTKLIPSCQFIHHYAKKNIKKEVGDSKITQKLDKCTALAAEQEQCEEQYKCFSDVIKFDGQTDIHHFPGLWKGGPPMAPVDEEYSDAAQKLKQHFIESLHKRASSSCGCGHSLSHLDARIGDLWHSLLEENFVFSFKNTMEIIAYKALETEWSRNWRWPLHEKMLMWEKLAENKITAADTVPSVSEVVCKKCDELATFVSTAEAEIAQEMKEFFDNQQSEQIEQWRPTFQQRLKILFSSLKQHAEHHCIRIGESRKAIFGYDKNQVYASVVREGVSNHIKQIQSNGVPLGPQPEAVLKEKFDGLWEELMLKIPYISESCDIEAEVEAKLLEYYSDYRDKIRKKLGKRKLTKRGQHLQLIVKEHKHLKIHVVGMVRTFFGSSLSPDFKAMTNGILEMSRQHLQEKSKERHDFNSGLVIELLHLVDKKIEEESRKIEITVTPKYKVDVFLTVCGYAVPVFERMAYSFRERNDPRIYLQKNVKHILFTQFVDQCRQVEAEEGIANTLCVSFEEPIKTQIRINNMGVIMVRKFKASESHCFTSKMALKAKILTDILEEDNFKGYIDYVWDVKKCLEKRIKMYVIKFSDTKPKWSKSTRLQLAARDEVSRLVQIIKKKVHEVKKENFQDWLSEFCEDEHFEEELGIKLKVDDLLEGYNPKNVQNLESFSDKVKAGLCRLTESLHKEFETVKCKKEVENWRDKPHEIMKDLIGCTAQCPFCGEQCDIGNEHDSEIKHRTAIHRPSNLASWRNSKTQVMVVDFCPALVSSKGTFKCQKTNDQPHPYKDYQTIYPDWAIPADVTSQDSLYWKWFVAKYNDDIARHYNAKPPSIPSQWLGVTKETLKKHLDDVHHL